MPLEDSSLSNSPTRSAPAPTLSQPKPQPKFIRVLTVMAYMLSVSMAAILLSIYYIFVWNGGGTGKQQQPSPAPLISLRNDYDNNSTFEMIGGTSTEEWASTGVSKPIIDAETTTGRDFEGGAMEEGL